MAWKERAMERMYGDINLTDELIDDEAEVLLKWGEAEHTKLENEMMDEETREEKAASVRKVMKRVNGFIGKWGSSDSEKAQRALAKLVDALNDLGYDVAAEQVENAINGTANNMSALVAVLGLLRTDTDDDPDATKPAAPGLDLLEKPTDTDDPLGAKE